MDDINTEPLLPTLSPEEASLSSITPPIINREIDEDIDLEALQAIFDAENIKSETVTEAIVEEETGIFAIFKNYEKDLKAGILELFKFYYPEELYDIVIEDLGRDGVTYHTILHYPHLIVSNDQGRTHPIKDLYIKFDIYIPKKGLGFSLINLGGKRLTLSMNEIKANYQFSHLSGGITSGWGGFCLGDSTPISNLFRKLYYNEDNRGQSTLEDLYKFFLLLDTYVTWESLSGGPYKLMENIGNNIQVGGLSNVLYTLPKNNNLLAVNESLISNIMKYILYVEKYFNMLYTECIEETYDGGFNLKFDSLTGLIKQICMEQRHNFSRGVQDNDLFYFDDNKFSFIQMFPQESDSGRYDAIKYSTIKFKGQTLKFKLDGEEFIKNKYAGMTIDSPNVYLKPSYTYSIYGEILKRFNIFLYKTLKN